MLKAAVISNNVEGIEHMFTTNNKIAYTLLEITSIFDPDFTGYDLLVVPNGSDNIALYRIREKILQFLNQGKVLFCFDGWYTNWVPGNKWIMNTDYKTIDIRYHLVNDKHKLFEGIDFDKFNFTHGISGWWACGYIETSQPQDVLMADTWNRPIIVIDEHSTEGLMVLTASGPMADLLFGTNSEGQTSWDEIGRFYQKLIDFVTTRALVKI